jgi:hypothetical protein
MSWLKLGLQSAGKLFNAGKAPIASALGRSAPGSMVVAGRGGRIARIQDTLRVSGANMVHEYRALSPAAQSALKKTGIAAAAVPVGWGLLNSGSGQQVPPGYGQGYYRGYA